MRGGCFWKAVLRISRDLSVFVEAVPDALSSATSTPWLEKLRIGLVAQSSTDMSSDDASRGEALERTLQALSEAFYPGKIELLDGLDIDALKSLIEKRHIDAFISSSGFYWQMLHGSGVRAIATRSTPYAVNPNASAAAVVLVPEGSGIEEFSDLKGKRIGASRPNAFTTRALPLAALAAETGLLPDESGIQWTYVHKTGGTALLWLLDVGRVDAVFLRACWLEENNVQIEGKWRVLEPFEDSLACRHSTKSVPGMTLAVTDAVSPDKAAIIARTVFTMKDEHEAPIWGGVRRIFGTSTTSFEPFCFFLGRGFVWRKVKHFRITILKKLNNLGLRCQNVRFSIHTSSPGEAACNAGSCRPR